MIIASSVLADYRRLPLVAGFDGSRIAMGR
jgi:hypothetical protein